MWTDKGWMETADVSASLPPFELYHGEAGLDVYTNRHHVSQETAKTVHGVMLNAPKWMPFASDIYKTSENVKDYFLVPTIIMPSDLPNRNGSAFPLKELSTFSPEIGNLAYMGWNGKPVHVEHDNMNPEKAIGMVVDVAMRKMKNSSLWKVLTLLAIDRTKRPEITGEILAGRRNNYSMGALVKGHQCSICGSRSVLDKSHRTRYDGLKCRETHASLSRKFEFRTFEQADGTTKLGFLNVHGIMPIEVSSVGVPAYSSAETSFEDIQSF